MRVLRMPSFHGQHRADRFMNSPNIASAAPMSLIMMACFVLHRSTALVGWHMRSGPRCRLASRVSFPGRDDLDSAKPTPTGLLHPMDLLDGAIPYPKSLSPSAIMEFKKCPQSYLFQYLWGLRKPTNLVLAKGTMCHAALEKVFDLQPEDRTLENLQNLFRVSWGKERKSDTYRILFEKTEGEWDTDAEKEWGKSGLKLLENYYQLEDPTQISRPNPVRREVWVTGYLSEDPTLGCTAAGVASPTDAPKIHVRGIVDRLDMYRTPENGQPALRIVDYKSGKAPNLKYSPAMNKNIVTEAFYQLKIYALLLRETNAEQTLKGMDLRMLRLLFLTSESGPGQYLDLDMGPTREERDALLNEIHVDIANVWTTIKALVATQDPKAFVGCDRSFCYCHQCRPRFLPGTLWEP